MYDSQKVKDTPRIEIGFKNLVNEFYSRDLSEKIKKVKMLQMKKGYTLWYPAYGYKKTPEDKYKIVTKGKTYEDFDVVVSTVNYDQSYMLLKKYVTKEEKEKLIQTHELGKINKIEEENYKLWKDGRGIRDWGDDFT